MAGCLNGQPLAPGGAFPSILKQTCGGRRRPSFGVNRGAPVTVGCSPPRLMAGSAL